MKTEPIERNPFNDDEHPLPVVEVILVWIGFVSLSWLIFGSLAYWIWSAATTPGNVFNLVLGG